MHAKGAHQSFASSLKTNAQEQPPVAPDDELRNYAPTMSDAVLDYEHLELPRVTVKRHE